MTNREQQILEILRHNPLIPQLELADLLGLSRSAVAGHIMQLTRKGYIQGKGYIIAPDRYAIVIGGANIDLCGHSSNPIVLQDSNPGHLDASAGGVGRNIAENLARLGSTVEFIGAFGGDSWGQDLKDSCHQCGIGTDHSLYKNDAKTSSYLSILDDQGELLVALNDMQLIESLNANELSKRAGVIDRASVLVLDANLPEDALNYLFTHHGTKPIFVDPVSSIKASKLIPYLDKIDCLKPNILEAKILAGVDIDADIAPSQLAKSLHDKGVPQVAISLGSEGVLASSPYEQHVVPAIPTQVNNVTGAGDAMMAGLIHSYLNNRNWVESVEFAIGASHLAITVSETINKQLTEQAVLDLLEESPQC
ncbi:kinase [Vibrio sp. qd031]|uniref:PfkB family carbohydrate kinase n=1 Tax=Vibrio sp. qd031 TaxID=1603038 RepID=UPI000A10DB4B|nr:PfkB family carbohydrate kinase [Vibrio sp. qd031]ORT48631.1 kinase [Vibrio sp. qd031]